MIWWPGHVGELLEALEWLPVLLLAVGAAVLSWLARSRPRGFTWAAAAALVATLVGILVLGGPSTHSTGVGIALVLGLSLAFAGVIGGSPAVVEALRWAEVSREGSRGGIVVEGEDGDREVLRGGRTIGYLERAATVAVIAAGYPEAIAVVVALKGVGRFTELTDPAARERFIIGSLASLVWAGVAGGALRLLFV